MGNPTQGLLYVASRIRSLARISPDVYNAWYDEIHVPHVLETPGIKQAFRYESTATSLDSTPWPFLALYPIQDIQVFNTEEFTSIPLCSDALPGPTHSCLDIAEFDNRRYRLVGKIQDADTYIPIGSKSHLLLVEFDLPSQIDGSDDQATLDWFSDIYSGNVYQWVSIYKIFWSSLYKDEQLADLPAYLALLQLNGDKNTYQQASQELQELQFAAKVDQWKLRRAFHC
ncbi:uncharacterized protein BO96DRAFT_418982 [Aspergillus niger CBS 101883]|uniref:Contig An16c0200, genomic contig n=3 Tax=Aspergillus niger TaxID=5061 RepID=A2R8C6_ASPNC|nr:uncharacterized protein BO96DRAFT_418982 [Aspergillus niger CBS 101883]XP_059604878.1 uncharacterized protein An16g06660 [Aspergillus niger]PYH61333.1 hypothetical protein BO96DRAFT_418982 [Aspergillus niger CBS 101883]CAK47000.1 unnamed protein product [Aspergillus niger]